MLSLRGRPTLAAAMQVLVGYNDTVLTAEE